MTLISQAGPGRLAVSALPLANEALAAGYDARIAARRAADKASLLAKVLAKPLPEASRERRWALGTRARVAAEAQLADRWAASRLTGWRWLAGQLPADVAADVEQTVWHGGAW